jgi:hypothetical protein
LAKLPSRKYAVVGSLCVAYAVYASSIIPSQPILLPDSADYATFAPVRLLGYPLFVRVLGPYGAIAAQPLLYAGALAILGLDTLLASSSVALAAAVVVAAMVNPLLNTYHASILTESISMTALVLLLAGMIRFVRKPSTRAAVWVGIAAGAAATVRPMAYALIPVVVIMVLIIRTEPARLRRLLAAVAVPILGMLTAERLAAAAIHKQESTSLMGRVMFAKAAMIDAPAAERPERDPLRADLQRTLDVAYSPVRALVNGAPSNDVHQVLTLYYEACLQWTCVERLRLSTGLSDAQVNDVMREVGVERIRRAPRQYVALWWTHFRALWTAYPARHPATAHDLNSYVLSHRPLPFESDLFGPPGRYAFEIQPYAPAVPARYLLFVCAWLTAAMALVGVAAAVGRRALPLPLAVASLASLTVHGGLMLTAALTIGTSRFMASFLPVVTTATLFSVWFVVQLVRGRRDRGDRRGASAAAR